MSATAKSIPFVLPAQAIPAVQAITQTELAGVIELRHNITQLETDLELAEQAIHLALESGRPVEPGTLRAFLKTVERRSVAWKSVVERELGPDYARRVLAATKPDTSTQLVVTA